MIGSFTQLEEQDVQKNAKRVVEAISDDVSSLSGVASDWAAWDETYSFIEDGDLNYVKRNIQDTTFVDIRHSLPMAVHRGEKVQGGASSERGYKP